MDRKELKREIVRLYAGCGSYILQCGNSEKNGVFTTRFKHPTCRKIIEVTENISEILCVLVYNETTNATQRDCTQCKTIEQFRRAIA